MRILLISDIHQEFWARSGAPRGFLNNLPDPSEYDTVVAAGDIVVGEHGPQLLREMFPDKPVIYHPGNHEYYHDCFERLNEQLEREAKIYDVHLLNPGSVVVDYTRFIGATLWSDMRLNGYPPLEQYDMRGFPDFKVIAVDNGKDVMNIEFMAELYRSQREFIRNELAYSRDIGAMDRTVVVTHFVPTQLCIHPRFLNSPFNPYFVNDFDDVMDEFKYPLHLFGHTHDPYDLVHPYGTRLVCNPLGYPNEVSGKYEHKIIEI